MTYDCTDISSVLLYKQYLGIIEASEIIIITDNITTCTDLEPAVRSSLTVTHVCNDESS